MRLVGPNGEQVGIVRVEDALRLAQEADLDLVEVAPQAKPPVCKLMDYGKFKYESAIKDREARKNQANTVLKTVRLRLKIDPHDYETKRGMAQKFLESGDKVKVMIMFRGREQSRPEMGYRLLQRFAGDVDELGSIESNPQQDGRNMVMVIGPHRRKAEVKAGAKAEQRRRRDSAGGHRVQEEAAGQLADEARAAAADAQEADTPAQQPAQPAPVAAQPAPAAPAAQPAPQPAQQAPRPGQPARPAPAPTPAPAARPARPAPAPAARPAPSARPAQPAQAPVPQPPARTTAAPAQPAPRPAAPRPGPARPGPRQGAPGRTAQV
ncbi:translation initiation factor IF-3 [Quadrisphaera sp. DSM 44207]|uniref:translation initiation factor IF-3 n=1 Tax=Quadrisphaera sp. DSM 44207 TaxID=1881057 RepID=UPI00088CBACE|nr:translation initiation factor IF-3 [Quadrisphaera sp. DSM 44207]